MVWLLEVKRVTHQNAVAVYDGVEPVSDGEHSAISEVFPDRSLDQLVSPRAENKTLRPPRWSNTLYYKRRLHLWPVPGVDVGRGLIDDENAVLPQDGSGQTYQLPLAHAEVGARLGQKRLHLGGKLLHHRLQLNLHPENPGNPFFQHTEPLPSTHGTTSFNTTGGAVAYWLGLRP